MSTTGVRAMQVSVLGSIGVELAQPVALGGPTQRRVLAVLALHAGEVVSVDRLVDAVWLEGDAPDRADHNVRTYVHRLRAALGDDGRRIETAGNGYRLHLERHELDALRFEDLVTEGRAAAARDEHDEARRCFDDALAFWGGRPYDEFADEKWLQAEVTRLDELRASAVEHRNAALLAAGRHTEVIGELRDAASEQPWREVRRMQLALALYRSGRQAEALQVLRDFRSQLVEELGLDPSPELGRLEHRILEHDPELLPASHRRHDLHGYRLDEVVGEGAFALVWRGVQPSLERTVAVKQIRAELANHPDFVRRFETEAQTVAMLEHPHIVPLYDYWREPDGAYLVMRYVSGGSLESEVLQGGLDESRLRRFVDQAGSALAAAHRMGVIHRDVKAANVLLDDDGNFYLTDFGIAFIGSSVDDELATSLSTGSPAYASPEQLRRQALDVRTDIYGFGITLFEAATGRLPFVDAATEAALVKRQLDEPVPAPSSVEPSVPPWVDQIVARATAKNPSDRYASMAELMSAVAPGAGGPADLRPRPGTSTVVGDLVNPFKALRAFREADTADFFGRNRLVARFVEVLSQPGSAGRLLAVVGPSGSGKSSVVRSGLVPQLRRDAVSGSADWFITTMLPGNHPFDEFESALSRVAVRQPGPLVEIMRSDERGIARAVNQILPDEESELLVVIDQFEEVFTHGDDTERIAFVNGLVAALREPRARLRVVLTIRADFWDRPLRHPGLAARLEKATVTVPPLAADELEAAVVEPVRRQGASYEPGLVARILADVRDQPGALPLLQYALTELFDANVSGLIRTESYEAIGGLTGALAMRAEQTFTAMSAGQQIAARRLFGRLVSLGEGTEDTRRRVRLGELGDGLDTEAVIDAFGEARLLVFDYEPATREPTVEVAHEALIRAWPRLRIWLDEDRDGLRIQRHLTETTAAWLASGRDNGELYRGGRLDAATAWSEDHTDDLNESEREFVAASVSLRDAEVAVEQQHTRQQMRSNRRLRVAAAIATLIALIAAGAGVIAVRERDRSQDAAASAEAAQLDAEREAARAEAQGQQAKSEAERARAAQLESELQRLTRDALLLREQSPEVAILLAAAAHRLDPGPLSLGALQLTLTRTDGLLGYLGSDTAYTQVLFPNDETVVAKRAFGLDIWDVPTGTLRHSFGISVGTMVSAGESHVVVATHSPNSLQKIDVTTGDRRAVRGDVGAVSLAVERSTGRVATVPIGVAEITILDADLAPLSSISLDAQPDTLAFVDGDLIVTNEFVVERITQSGDVVWSTDGVDFEERFGVDPGDLASPRFEDVQVSDDGSRVFANQPTWGVSVLDAADGALLDIVSASTRTEGLSVSGGRVVAGIHVFEQSDLSAVREIEPGAVLAAASAMAPSGRTVALAGEGGLSLWSLDGRQLLARSASASSPKIAAIDGTGSRISWTDWPNGTWGLADLDSGSAIDAALDDAWQAGWLPSGDLMTYEIASLRTKIWGDDLAPDGVGVPPQQWSMFVPTPDGRLGVAGEIPSLGDISVFDLATGERAATIPHIFGDLDPGDNPLAGWADFSSDGALMVVPAWQGPAALIDTETWTVLELLYGPADTTINSAAFSHDDSLLAIHTGDGRLHVVELATGSTSTLGFAGEPAASSLMQAMAWGPDDDTIVLGLQDGVRMWDVSNGVAIGGAFPNESLNVASQSYDGRFGVTAIGDEVLVWDLDTARWIDVACRAVGRDLTDEEWDQYGPSDTPYREVCPR